MELTHYNLEAINALLCLRRERKISWRAFGLGVVIASFSNKTTGEAWPSRATLEAITGIDMRDISRTTGELEESGFLAVGERNGQSNMYRLTLGEIAAKPLGKQPPTLGEIAAKPLGKQPPTLGEIAAKPLGKQPPITMKEQSINNEITAYAQNDVFPTSEGDAKHTSEAPGNQTPSPTPSRAKPKAAKVTWDGTRIVVPDAFMESWSESYPSVDLRLAIKRASSWCLSNPGKRPKKDFARFLNSWFQRVKPGNPEYVDLEEQAADDAALIRQAEETFPDPDERADFFYQRKRYGLRNPPGVDCRPMPTEKEAVV